MSLESCVSLECVTHVTGISCHPNVTRVTCSVTQTSSVSPYGHINV